MIKNSNIKTPCRKATAKHILYTALYSLINRKKHVHIPKSSLCLGDLVCIYGLAFKTFIFATFNVSAKGLFDFTD